MSGKRRRREKARRQRAAQKAQRATGTARRPAEPRSGAPRAERRASRSGATPRGIRPMPVFVQTRAVRTVVAVGFTMSSAFAVYLLARAVAAFGDGAGIAELVVLCIWFAGVAGLGFTGAAAVARGRRLAPGLWAWSAGLAGGAAVFLALVLSGRSRATEPSLFATATLALGLAAFACIAGLSLFQMRGTLRADRAAGRERRRPPGPPDTLPGTPLYR